VREAAPAKLNLDLLVTGRRPDGYHLLDSLVVFADLGDELAFAPAPDLRLKVVGPMAGGLPAGVDNIVVGAARRLAALAGIRPRAAITLDKRLPVAAGIGGGSSDAAAALRGLCRLWGLSPGAEMLQALALELGADVPVCLRQRPARMRGIGERLDPLPAMPTLHLVLVNPCRPLPTAAVFGALRLDRCGPRAEPPDPADLLDTLRRSRNDLEAPARLLLPAVDEVLAALAHVSGCRLARMSGSGPTCFGLFPDAAASANAAAELRERHPGWWVEPCRTGAGR
jgi:4-diphosphocytidyl-2-C-methyl-D-erythritol kinase